MSMKMTITTKGVQGAGKALAEFQAGIEQELLKHLPAYGTQTVSNMQANAPIRTGWLRHHIMSRFDGPTTLAITSWADYSGFVNYGTFRMPARPFFTREVEQAPRILSQIFAQASMNFLSNVIRKHQHGP